MSRGLPETIGELRAGLPVELEAENDAGQQRGRDTANATNSNSFA